MPSYPAAKLTGDLPTPLPSALLALLRTLPVACASGLPPSQIALQNEVTYEVCLEQIAEARAQGLTVPVMLMGASPSPAPIPIAVIGR